MCHVAVKEGTRTWHGACHLDDARQAPANRVWIDGYQQGEHETKYADNEHIPGLDWGAGTTRAIMTCRREASRGPSCR